MPDTSPLSALRVKPSQAIRLRDLDPNDAGPFTGKDDPAAAAQLTADIARLQSLQERLFAERKQSLLVIFQAMDAAGKDGVLRRVAGPLDSRGVNVWSFRAPAGEEREHDYFWRVHLRCPRYGEIGFFNRSHYEEVLVPRVMGWVGRDTWERRFDHINSFEKMLTDCGTVVVKFYLHISKEEQRARLQERLDDPSKRWKFDPKDLEARARWDDYVAAYEDIFARCSTKECPWFIVPANRKWYRDVVVARTLVEVLEEMGPKYPKPAYNPEDIHLK